MGNLIQYFKILFLFTTTVITIFFFFKNYRVGFNYYMLFLIISGLFGFARPIYMEEIILPILLTLTTLSQRNFDFTKISIISLFLFGYSIVVTLISNNSTFIGHDFIFFFGFILLTLSNFLFGKDMYSILSFALLWLYALSRVIWLIVNGGGAVFSIADITDGQERLMLINTGLEGTAAIAQIDPNYFAAVTGMGFILSLLFIAYKEHLYKYFPYRFVRKKWFLIIIILTCILELWFSIRAVSRGMILAILASLLVFLYLEKSTKILKFVSISIIVIYLFFQNIITLFLYRFSMNDLGGGRYDIWNFLWKYLVKDNKIIFGEGLNYPWWKDWPVQSDLFLGTHNSWITIFFGLGLIGIALLVTIILKSIVNNYKVNTKVSKIKIVMLVYVLIAYSSIEPLNYTWGWILFSICVSITPKMRRKHIIKPQEIT